MKFNCSLKITSKFHKISKKPTFWYTPILYIFDQNFMLVPTIKLLEFSDKNWETYKRLLIFWSIFWLFFNRPKFQKWNFIKNPWYTKILHCTTLIFIKKLEFCDFFKKVSIDCFSNCSLKITSKFHKISKKPTFWYTPIYYIFLIRILCSFQQSNY